MAIKKKDLEKLEKKLNAKYKKLRLALTDGLAEIEEIDDKIKKSIRSTIKNNVKGIIDAEMVLAERRVKRKVAAKIFNDHIKVIKKAALNIVEHAIKEGIIYETKTLKGDKFNIKIMNELYKDGWRIAMSMVNDNVITVIFHRPRMKKVEKKKKKVKRSPV